MSKLYKRYVDVLAIMTKDNQVIPSAIYWDTPSGKQQYLIDKFIPRGHRASVVGGCGILFDCMIQGRPRKLYYAKDGWFIESTKP